MVSLIGNPVPSDMQVVAGPLAPPIHPPRVRVIWDRLRAICESYMLIYTHLLMTPRPWRRSRSWLMAVPAAAEGRPRHPPPHWPPPHRPPSHRPANP